MLLNQRVVVVTGGTSALGQACVERIQAAGARLAIIDTGKERIAALRRVGHEAWLCDLSNGPEAESVFGTICARLGPTSVLINCAEIADRGSVLQGLAPMPLGEFKRVIWYNLVGTINAIRCAVAHMLSVPPRPEEEGERGVVINTSSIAATDGQMGHVAYAASKGGVSSMVLPLARELGDHGIRVNAIAAGVFSTATTGFPEKSCEAAFAAGPPFPKRPGKPQEFAELALNIIGSRYLNGATIRLDGGFRMPARI